MRTEIKLVVFVLIAIVLVAGCVGQTATTTGAALDTAANSVGSDLSGFGNDASDLATPDTDFTIP